jgi:hypothetical protein
MKHRNDSIRSKPMLLSRPSAEKPDDVDFDFGLSVLIRQSQTGISDLP